ncbi:cytosine methyltransferase [Candidatus Woesearchaeota archaeon]|jgi:site-specific DNA-methyltransferase (adenine-specific)|nr:cytosine methyltransferase [Candidatus Woesearchaeota archaeon]
MQNFELWCGDCLEEMNKIADESVDLILCDLPYGTTDRKGVEEKGNNRLLKWDTVIPLDLLWEQYRRILKPLGTVALTADQPFTSMLILSNLDWFKYEWIWKKQKTTGFLLANYRPMKETEDVVIFSPGGAAAASRNGKNMTYNPQGLIEKKVKKKNNAKRLGKFLHNPEHMGSNNKLLHETEYEQKWTNYPSEIIEFGLDRSVIHPTQKPVALMEYLIKTYSNEGDTVLDNCMGSGTTGVACKKTNRNFIGIEKESEYFIQAKERIESVTVEEVAQNPLESAMDAL